MVRVSGCDYNMDQIGNKLQGICDRYSLDKWDRSFLLNTIFGSLELMRFQIYNKKIGGAVPGALIPSESNIEGHTTLHSPKKGSNVCQLYPCISLR